MRKSTKKECRNCTECIAYCNMLDGNVCGLGFKVEEVVEGGYGTWNVMVRPYENNCEKINMPETKEDFIKTAAYLGIEWDIDDVLSADDFSSLQV